VRHYAGLRFPRLPDGQLCETDDLGPAPEGPKGLVRRLHRVTVKWHIDQVEAC
jgi:hypothetical protein